MKTQLNEMPMGNVRWDVLAISTKTKVLAVLEVLLVFAAMMALDALWRSTRVFQWEVQHLGWSYTGMLWWVDVPALIIWLTRRSWAEYGVSLANWPTNLDIGMKGYYSGFISLIEC